MSKTLPIDRLLWEATVSVTLPAGKTQVDVVRACVEAMSDFAGVPIGKIDLIGASNEPYVRSQTIFGKAAYQLRDHGFIYFVEDGQLHIEPAPKKTAWWPTAIRKPPKRRGRPKAPYWTAGDEFIKEWLDENGLPQPGDGEHAKLMKAVRDFVDGRIEKPPVKSTIQDHVNKGIREYKIKHGVRGE